MAMIDANGLAVHVERMPARTTGTAPPPTVVLIHGMLIDSLVSYYFTLAPRFAAAGLDVVMYDLRGQGHSERPPDGYRLEDHLDDLEALLDRLDPPGPVHLVGNSYGGTIAFGHAARHPGRVASVSMIESEPATAAWSRKMADNLARGAEELARDGLFEELTGKYGRLVTRRVRSAARLLHSTTTALDVPASRVLDEDAIRAVGSPVLALYGAESELAAQEGWLRSLLPNCRTVVVPDQEHWVLVGATDLAGDLILEWIRAHTPVPAAGEAGR
ncbi:alpha/beta hydrolase [Streptomyces sp. AV19]|uniref:alpha/beta fold hydrolase n=1 Tax=Streptomyces sp. AV19 TaxID=2793068 RepID=UPI0018FE887D|nr:alpha/beta hydrolase [Streptomyces sp. AV19]MBH1937604.1 alpha/beta hydrolase [Streptomyces sp. AV19]MDG4536463.1 alpha/beta hydrolase [Streptomyces sp. AV19]